MSEQERDQFDEEVRAVMKELDSGMGTLRQQVPVVQRESDSLLLALSG